MALGLNIDFSILDVVSNYANTATTDRMQKQENIFYCKPVKYDVYSIALKNLTTKNKLFSSIQYWLKGNTSQNTLVDKCRRSR